ncbi:hypothetical protein R3P38DRAFT_3168440 [Favolaschia claudopus]|uniref:Uncharacterized protein n=1 Tax=Favolaschia claudopus TaxID=2862362 RepID=A0AAW0E943_9AGAR
MPPRQRNPPPKPKLKKMPKPSPVEALLRERVGDPDQDAFDTDPCARGGLHRLQLLVGADREEDTSVWVVVCTGIARPCPLQRGQPYPPAVRRELQQLADDYRAFYPAIESLEKHLANAQASYNELAGKDIPALPRAVATKLSKKLDSVRDLLSQMDYGELPADPSSLGPFKGTLAPRPQNNARPSKTAVATKAKKRSVPATITAKNPAPKEKEAVMPGPIPNAARPKAAAAVGTRAIASNPGEDEADDMVILLPTCRPGEEYVRGSEARVLHGMIFFCGGANPQEVYFDVPRASCFQFSKYKLPDHCQQMDYERYSVARDEYIPAADDCNMSFAGGFVIYRKVGLPEAQCPGIDALKQKAESMRVPANGGSQGTTSSSVRRSSRVQSQDFPGPSQPVASSSQVTLVDSSESSNKKRKIEDGEATRRSRSSRRTVVPANTDPLRRITDPYKPPEQWLSPPGPGEEIDVPVPRISEEDMKVEEPARILHNAKISKLEKANASAHCKLEKMSWETTDARAYIKARDRAGDKLRDYTRELWDYQDKYGKWVPDADNAAWFQRKGIREEALLALRKLAVTTQAQSDFIKYFAKADAFREDFGHNFYHDDGLDDYLKQVEHRLQCARSLDEMFAGDSTKMAEYACQPVVFECFMPFSYPMYGLEDAFKAKARELVCELYGRRIESSPRSDMVSTFRLTNRHAEDPDRRLQEYYRLRYVAFEVQAWNTSHLSCEQDDFEEYRDFPWEEPRPLW